MKRIAIGAALVVVLALVLFASLRGSGGKGVEVEVEEVARRTVAARVKASGEINPRRKVEIQSKVIGEIVALPVVEGQAVAAGQVVVEVEKKLYQAARDQARGALEQARVNLERARVELASAERELRRIQDLRADGVVSEQAVDQARLAYDSAEIAVRAQQETIRQAESGFQRAVEDLDRTTIRSPIDGTVTALNVERGETAIVGTMGIPGSVLMVVGDLSEMIAEVEVAESEVVSLALGQAAEVTLDALPERPMRGRVTEIAASGSKIGDVVKFMVKVTLDAPEADVRPGMTAKVEITTAVAEDVVAVPQQAVQSRWLDAGGEEVSRREGDESQREATVVYVVEDGTAVRRPVTTGVQDELWAAVEGELAAGETVIVGPYRTLRKLESGERVRVKEAGPAAGKDD